MKSGRPSVTATFVAACRGLAPVLPRSARLVDDPWGARVLGDAPASAIAALGALPEPLRALAWVPLAPLLPWAVYMQVRTRALDDALRDFYAVGGRQVVVLGAGYDARSHRLREALPGVTFFEVDHPATQSARRARFGESTVARSLAWDFERDPLPALPARLAAVGHDPARPTITLWEGVTMYLTRAAFDATLGAVRDYSAPASRLAFNYVERHLVASPNLPARVVGAVVGAAGEPFRLGFDPPGARDALAAHGFRVIRDDRFEDLAAALLPPPWPRLVGSARRLALVERTATAERV